MWKIFAGEIAFAPGKAPLFMWFGKDDAGDAELDPAEECAAFERAAGELLRVARS